jgi:hypothetical protein
MQYFLNLSKVMPPRNLITVKNHIQLGLVLFKQLLITRGPSVDPGHAPLLCSHSTIQLKWSLVLRMCIISPTPMFHFLARVINSSLIKVETKQLSGPTIREL